MPAFILPASLFMEKFIDIHNHVIFDFDDGPESLTLSLDMLRQAADQNIGVIYATSHFDEYTPETKLSEYYQKLDTLRQEAEKNNLDVVIYPGAEIYYHSFMLESLKKYKNYVLGENSGFVLFEFPMFQNFSNIDLIFQLRINKYKPVIAHPERYVAVLSDWTQVLNFVKMGGIIQINAGSLLGHYGSPVQKVAMRLLENKLVHIVASDAHNTSSRPFLMHDAYEYCLKYAEKDYCNQIFFEIPSKIIHAQPFEPSVPALKQEQSFFRRIVQSVIHKRK